MRRKGASKNDPMERLRCSATCGMQSWKYDPLERAVMMLLSSDLLPHVEVKESDKKTAQAHLAGALAKQEKARMKIANLTKAIEDGGLITSLVKALKAAEQEEQQANEEVQSAQDTLQALEITKQSAVERQHTIAAMAKAMKADRSGQLRERLRYALSRSVDRIVLEDSKECRTARIEVGSAVRHIDFNRTEKTFTLRGDDFTGVAYAELTSGGRKAIIP